MDKYKWGVVEVLTDGHRLFPEHEGVRFAIADDSGREPQDTDDGILWLDFSRKLMVEKDHVAIPLSSPAMSRHVRRALHMSDTHHVSLGPIPLAHRGPDHSPQH